MIETNTPPLAASIWSFCEAQDDCPVKEATDKKLLYTLLPRAEGKITQRGLEIFGLRFQTALLKAFRFCRSRWTGNCTDCLCAGMYGYCLAIRKWHLLGF